jgi:hypothetical protein
MTTLNKTKRKRKMHHPKATTGVVLGCLLLATGKGVEANGKSKFLRTNDAERRDRTIRSPGVSEMEDLWENMAAVAKIELEVSRALRRSHDFSMPSAPNRPSSARPSKPTPSPPATPPSLSPGVDCLKGRTREEYILDALLEVSEESLLTDPSTPQGKAFEYMATTDPHLSDPCASTTLQQRFGLTTMYYALGGEEWKDSQGWLGEEHECLWFGIECTGGNPGVATMVTLGKSSIIFSRSHASTSALYMISNHAPFLFPCSEQ